jgi:hypothetical protein
MSLANRKRIVRNARATGLRAAYGERYMRFWAEDPADPHAAPYFSSTSPAQCQAFIAGWAARLYEATLRRLKAEKRSTPA